KPCPYCKADNDDEAANCHECGAKLGIPEKATIAQGQNILKIENESFSRRAKWLCWFAAWGGVALAVFVINPAYFRAAFLFPIGLFAFFANGTQTAFWAWGTGGFIFGWVLYVVLSAVLFGAKNK